MYEEPSVQSAVINQIPDWLSAHGFKLPDASKYLGDDWCHGRGTGEVGSLMAAHLIASAFTQAGLEPLDDGGLFHGVNFEHPDMFQLTGSISITDSTGKSHQLLARNGLFNVLQQPIGSSNDLMLVINYEKFNYLNITGHSEINQSTIRGKWNGFLSIDLKHYDRRRIRLNDIDVARGLERAGACGVIIFVDKLSQKEIIDYNQSSTLGIPLIFISGFAGIWGFSKGKEYFYKNRETTMNPDLEKANSRDPKIFIFCNCSLSFNLLNFPL